MSWLDSTAENHSVRRIEMGYRPLGWILVSLAARLTLGFLGSFVVERTRGIQGSNEKFSPISQKWCFVFRINYFPWMRNDNWKVLEGPFTKHSSLHHNSLKVLEHFLHSRKIPQIKIDRFPNIERAMMENLESRKSWTFWSDFWSLSTVSRKWKCSSGQRKWEVLIQLVEVDLSPQSEIF